MDVDSKDNLFNPNLANKIDGTNLFGFKPKETHESDHSEPTTPEDLSPYEAEERRRSKSPNTLSSKINTKPISSRKKPTSAYADQYTA